MFLFTALGVLWLVFAVAVSSRASWARHEVASASVINHPPTQQRKIDISFTIGFTIWRRQPYHTVTMTTIIPPSPPIQKKRPRVKRQARDILHWPTDTVSIDYYDDTDDDTDTQGHHVAHTILLFVPGNPGCIEWYIPLLTQLVTSLGEGFAARGVSYAGHGTTSEICHVQNCDNQKQGRDPRIPWTVNGQMDHKMAWIDTILEQMTNHAVRLSTKDMQRFVFLTHSIGAHLVQRLLLLRPDILKKTQLVIHLMPFLRMDAPQPQQTMLSAISNHSDQVILLAQTLSKVAKMIPPSWLDSCMRHLVQDDEGRQVAISLLQQSDMAQNFFELGCAEIRDLPQVPDVSII